MQYFIKKWVHNIEISNNHCYVTTGHIQTKIFEQLNQLFIQRCLLPSLRTFKPKNSDKFLCAYTLKVYSIGCYY
jgi:hypothetical protein